MLSLYTIFCQKLKYLILSSAQGSMFRRSIMAPNPSMLQRGSISAGANLHSMEQESIRILEGPFLIHPFSTMRSIWVVLTFFILFA